MSLDPNDILMGAGGPPAAKFDGAGVTITGRIIAPPRAYQEREYDPQKPGGGAPRFFPSGDPIMGLTVDVQTTERTYPDDDGARRIYVQGRRLKEAVRNAVQQSGARGLEVGGELTVTFTHWEDPQDKRSAKHYEARYTPAASAGFMEGTPTVTAPPQQAPAYALSGAGTGVPAPAPAADQVAVAAAMANLPPEVLAAIQAAQK